MRDMLIKDDSTMPIGWITLYKGKDIAVSINPVTISRIERKYLDNNDSIAQITFVDGYNMLVEETVVRVYYLIKVAQEDKIHKIKS